MRLTNYCLASMRSRKGIEHYIALFCTIYHYLTFSFNLTACFCRCAYADANAAAPHLQLLPAEADAPLLMPAALAAVQE